MVNLIADWNVLQEYTDGKPSTTPGGCFKVRVKFGRLGFKKEYNHDKDKQLNQILDFSKKRNFIRLGERIRDEDFFN